MSADPDQPMQATRSPEATLQGEMQQLQQRLCLLTEKMSSFEANLESLLGITPAPVGSMVSAGSDNESGDGCGPNRIICDPSGQRSEPSFPRFSQRISRATTSLQRMMHAAKPDPATAVHSCVNNPWFETATNFMILLNSVFLAVELEVRAVHPDDAPPSQFFAIRVLFLAFCVAELFLRVGADRGHFWLSDNWMWNVFDSAILVSFIFEIVLGANVLSFIRIVRVFRVLRNFTQLRMMIVSIYISMKPLICTLFLLLVMIYITAVALTQGTLDHMKDVPPGAASPEELSLMEHYGHLHLSIYTLSKAFTGGSDWGDVLTPLFVLNPFYSAVFLGYIAFMLLAVINIIAAIFVEAAVQSGQVDAAYGIRQERVHEDTFLEEMHQIFRKADKDGSCTMSLAELEECFSDETVRLRLKCLGLDVSQARDLFDALGVGMQNEISSDDFARKCLRLRGHARCVDTANLRRAHRKTEKRLKCIEGRLVGILGMPHSQPAPALQCQGSGASERGAVDRRSQSLPAVGGAFPGSGGSRSGYIPGAASVERSASWRTAGTSRGGSSLSSWFSSGPRLAPDVQWQQGAGHGIGADLEDDLNGHGSRRSSRASEDALGSAAAGGSGVARAPPHREGNAAARAPAHCTTVLGLLCGCGQHARAYDPVGPASGHRPGGAGPNETERSRL